MSQNVSESMCPNPCPKERPQCVQPCAADADDAAADDAATADAATAAATAGDADDAAANDAAAADADDAAADDAATAAADDAAFCRPPQNVVWGLSLPPPKPPQPVTGTAFGSVGTC